MTKILLSFNEGNEQSEQKKIHKKVPAPTGNRTPPSRFGAAGLATEPILPYTNCVYFHTSKKK